MPFASEPGPDQDSWGIAPPTNGAPGEPPPNGADPPAPEAPGGASGYPDELRDLWSRPQAGEQPLATTAPALAAPPTPPPGETPPAPQVPAERRRPVLSFRHHLLVLGFALLGGPLGIAGALVQELQAGGLGFLLAGVIEEALKPAGIYVVLAKWPYALRGRLYTACFSALSGLLFGIIEACTYVFVYFPDKGSDFVLYRFTVPLVMHTLGSFIFGLGIRPGLIDWANGLTKFPKSSRNFFIAAMVLHAGFNLTVVILVLAGVLNFD